MHLPAILFSDVLSTAMAGCVGLAALHGLHRLGLLGTWLRRSIPSPPETLSGTAPFVTVQLPLYNERDVARRLIEACARLDWPRDRFDLQVLDDSTDDTRAVVDQAAAAVRHAGVHVEVVRRSTRTGFKAGALAAGLLRARGDLIAVFDADFVPDPTFLSRVIPTFADPRVGMVQARWGHLNADESWLTRAQASLLDGHFVIEHAARQAAGCWFNFNGTAGVWRRACIDGAGGWEGDTLTEDLDLSYRAQLAGWSFAYRPDVTVPAELPPSIAAFRVQQRRWAMGSIQVAQKLGRRIFDAEVPRRVRAEALAHLWANLAWLPALGLIVGLPWTVLARVGEPPPAVGLVSLALCTLPNVVFYRLASGSFRDVVPALLLAIGLAPAQARAVVEALVGRRPGFARTPKRGEGGRSSYEPDRTRGWLELGLVVPHLAAAALAIARGHASAAPFLLFFAAGLAWVGSGAVGARSAARGEHQKGSALRGAA